MKKFLGLSLLSMSVMFGTETVAGGGAASSSTGDATTIMAAAAASSGTDYSTHFESAKQQQVHFENKGRQPVEFDVTATITRVLAAKETQKFTTDDGFYYAFNGKEYRRGTLVNPHDKEASFTLTGPDGNRIPQQLHITLASGETIDLTLGFMSYFIGLQNLIGMTDHLAWDVNERGLNVLLGVSHANSSENQASFPKAFEKVVEYAKYQISKLTNAGYLDSNVDAAVQYIQENRLPVPVFMLSSAQGSFQFSCDEVFKNYLEAIPSELRNSSQRIITKFRSFLSADFCRPHPFKFLVVCNINNSDLEHFKNDVFNSCPLLVLGASPILKSSDKIIPIPYSVLASISIIDSAGENDIDPNHAKAYLKTLLAILSSAKKDNTTMTVRKFPIKATVQNMPQILLINKLLHGTSPEEYERNRNHLISASQQLSPVTCDEHQTYLIPPITHRIWLTDNDKPQEVPVDKLEHYHHSVRQFSDTTSRHMFWCFNPDDIPETIRILRTFSPPIEIHTIDEVAGNFKCKPLISKLLRDKLFIFASDIIRKEVLYQLGGVYNDVGLRQQYDISGLLRYSKHMFYLNENGYIDMCVMGFEKESEFLSRDLLLISSLSRLAKTIRFPANPLFPQNWTTSSALVTTAISNKWDNVYFVRQNREFIYHGMRLWNTSPQYKVLQDNPNYYFEE